MTRKHKVRMDAFAVVRVDEYQDNDASWETRITVKEVVFSQELAEQEVDRLQAINFDKECYYFWLPTRVFPEGHSAGPESPVK